MIKWWVIIFVSIILIVAGFFGLNRFIYNEKQGSNNMDNTQNTTDKKEQTFVKVTPISHATMYLDMGVEIVYVDPVGGKNIYEGKPEPSIILVTDIHSDHFSGETLSAITTKNTIVVVPQAVLDLLPEGLPGEVVILHNNEKINKKGIEIEGIPMYNIPESPDAFHTKGRGNGYVLSAGGQRVYIAGDTSATPEMKVLKDIDVAFVPMNLPFTMDVDEAAEGVIAFAPKVVHPYHYRGQNGLSDVNKFKELVEQSGKNIKVDLLNFYPEE